MNYADLDVNLTEEQRAMRDVAHKFGMEVMRPAGIKLDAMADPADVISKDSVLWDVLREYRKLGFHKRGMPKDLGGMAGEIDPLSNALMTEAFGYADAGLAISLSCAGQGFGFLAMSPDPELREIVKAYIEDEDCKMIGCWAITEPDHGSDWLLSADTTFKDPNVVPSLKARLVGDEYILSGQKSAWVSNGTIATHASLHVSLDPGKGMQGSGIAIVPLDLSGITKGKPLNKMGQRALNQGEIFFDEVRLPKKYMVVPDPNVASQRAILKMILTGANTFMSTTFAGLAKAAFDEALKYSRERIQGGKPIFEHQNIQLRLMKMFTMVEAARSLSRRTSAYAASGGAGSLPHAVAAKILATETATEVAGDAIQIFGGNGLSKEYIIEKMYRDAKASMIEDGENNLLAITAAPFL
jgi:alkylation response protein AidB-like acyl-CoA dehydrogenase